MGCLNSKQSKEDKTQDIKGKNETSNSKDTNADSKADPQVSKKVIFND